VIAPLFKKKSTGGYSEARYNEIVESTKAMLVSVGFAKIFVDKSVAFIPISARKGDNVVLAPKWALRNTERIV
jgi:translation elongation factor EF-1alpha